MPYPTNTPLTYRVCTLSAPPTCSTIRRPSQRLTTVICRRYTPVGTRSGRLGGGPSNGIWTFVYCGRSVTPRWSTTSCSVQLPGTATFVQRAPSAGLVMAVAGTLSGWSNRRKSQRPSSDVIHGVGVVSYGSAARASATDGYAGDGGAIGIRPIAVIAGSAQGRTSPMAGSIAPSCHFGQRAGAPTAASPRTPKAESDAAHPARRGEVRSPDRARSPERKEARTRTASRP